MAKVISKAQKTFVDLYDSYVLNLSSDVVAVPCDQYGAAINDYTTSISFSAVRGSKSVDSKCELTTNKPAGFTITINNTSDTIDIKIAKGTNFNDDLKIGLKVTTTDSSSFEFQRYITFIKIKSGEKNVTFQIYSEQGDVFTEGNDEITMKTVAFDGLTQITNATYKWFYYDISQKKWVEKKYDAQDDDSITNITYDQSYLVIRKLEPYSDSVFMCVMTYNNIEYKDYFTLKIINHTYDAVVKFFDGSNIFDAAEPFIVAYIQLYKDQQEEESIKTPYYYYHTGNTYDVTKTEEAYTFNSTSIEDKYKVDGTLMYMIYKIKNGDEHGPKYKIRLCQYNGNTGTWSHANASDYGNKYLYYNDMYENLYEDITTNVMVISKEDVARCKDINFTVYAKAWDDNGQYIYDNNLIISRANVAVFDLNDPIISSSEPTNAKEGQLWLDTSDPDHEYILKIYQGGSWIYFSQQNGKTVYTSEPKSGYSKGDLWILASGETCEYTINNIKYSFSEGTMLRAKQSASSFNPSHWEDAMSSFTTLKSNIEQYFTFSQESGLKIGQKDEKFYVNIDAQEMGFYDNTDGQNKKVVYIKNDSANIDNLLVENGAEFDCDATFNENVAFGNFIWQIESNGSLSLVVSD